MDATAIQEIGNNTAANNINEYLRERGLDVVAVPNDYSIADMEKYTALRRNFRLAFYTGDINEFARYVNECKDKSTQVFIDDSNMSATAVFDLGDSSAPGHAAHRAVLELTPTVEFSMAKKLFETQTVAITQQHFAEWMEDWRYTIRVAENIDGPALEIKQAITAVRKMSISKTAEAGSSIQSLSAEKTAMERIAVSGADSMPGFVFVKAVPFLHFNHTVFDFRVSVITGPEPKFKLRPVGFDLVKERIAAEFLEKLRTRITDCKVWIGTAKW